MNVKNYWPKLTLFIVLAQLMVLNVSGQVRPPIKIEKAEQASMLRNFQDRYNLSGNVEIRKGKIWYPLKDVMVLMEATELHVNTGIDGGFIFTNIMAVQLNKKIIFRVHDRSFDTIINRNLTAWTINVAPYRVRFRLEKIIEVPKDTDNDGIPDKDDNCPNVPGLAKYKGCPIPDTDGDGINDEVDKCPKVRGLAEYQGCPIPDTDGDGVNDKEDKCPNQKGTAENFGCPAKIDTTGQFTAKKTVTLTRPDDKEAATPKKMLQVALGDQRIIYTTGIERIIEKLNPGYKQNLLTQAETELKLPTFPEMEPERAQELQDEFEKGNDLDSVGTLLFSDKSRLAAKLFYTTVNLVTDAALRERIIDVQQLLEKAPQSEQMPLKKFQSDMLNPALSDFYDYYLDLAVKIKLDELDTAYFNEFYNQVSETFAAVRDMPATADTSRLNGPSAGILFDADQGYSAKHFFEVVDKRLIVYFYVFTADITSPRDSFVIYTLSPSQYRRLMEEKITFEMLDKNLNAKCPGLASPAGNLLSLSYPLYVVVVGKKEVSKKRQIYAAELMDVADRILLKDDRVAQKKPNAVAIDIK